MTSTNEPTTCKHADTISKIGWQYLTLQMASGIGPIRVQKLLKHLGTIDNILSASHTRLTGVEGIGDKGARAILNARSNDLIETEIELAADHGVRILCLEDDSYPAALRHIPDPPTCLYVRGQLEPNDAISLAIVGTRRCSHYGREQASRFGLLLGQAGFTVVSGLARGIDGLAHTGALRANGRTIAVLGNGLSNIYPPEHADLADKIEKNGAVVSELPMEAGPGAKNFPGRNRIIIGLSLGVLVVEAPKRSGALITARLANEYNREVFSIPGRIDQPEYTAGTNGLIRDGSSKLITCLADILDELGDVGSIMGRCDGPSGAKSAAPSTDQSSNTETQTLPLTTVEASIVKAVGQGYETVDDIAEATGQSISSVLSALTALQLKGQISQLPGQQYVLRKSKKS